MAGLNGSRASDGERGEGGVTRDELLAVLAAEEARVASLDREREAARARLEALRQRLATAAAPSTVTTSGLSLFPSAPIPQTPIEKVRLF